MNKLVLYKTHRSWNHFPDIHDKEDNFNILYDGIKYPLIIVFYDHR